MLFAATYLGIPISTTHTVTGAAIGVGAARKVPAVRWNIAANIVIAGSLHSERNVNPAGYAKPEELDAERYHRLYYQRQRGERALKVSDPATAFRLPKTILATVDAICAREDLTRSQVFRRSVVEYLKNQNAIVTDPNAPKPQEEWFAEWNQGRHRESPSQ